MRKLRFVLISLVVLALAQPMFACTYCNFDGSCAFTTQSTPKCKVTIDGCTDGAWCVGGGFTADLASDWEIASVEVKHSDDAAPQVTRNEAQAAVARLDVVEKSH